MKKNVIFSILFVLAAVVSNAQTQRIANGLTGGNAKQCRTQGTGNFGQIPLEKIYRDSILIDSILNSRIEKEKTTPPKKPTTPPQPKPASKKKPIPSHPNKQAPKAALPSEQKK